MIVYAADEIVKVLGEGVTGSVQFAADDDIAGFPVNEHCGPSRTRIATAGRGDQAGCGEPRCAFGWSRSSPGAGKKTSTA
jgi:hypothetical protein